MAAIATPNSQAFALAVYAPVDGKAALGEAFALEVYGPPASRNAIISQADAMIVFIAPPFATPFVSEAFAEIVYWTGVPSQKRNRCWTFVLDGHTFYVLDLGPQGTWLYDVDTKQWCKWITDGYGQWNMVNGTMWNTSRIVGCDVIYGNVWELVPSAVKDEGWRDLNHLVTGGISTRSRVFLSCDSLRVTGSAGIVDETAGATFSMRFSDDQGQTWSAYNTITLQTANFSQEMAWRSLGSFMAPGRLFEFSDVGGIIRIDGVDVFINGFDDETEKPASAPSQPGG
jgi:hypothetical protein